MGWRRMRNSIRSKKTGWTVMVPILFHMSGTNVNNLSHLPRLAITRFHAWRLRIDFTPSLTALLCGKSTELLALLLCEVWAVFTRLDFAIRVVILYDFDVTFVTFKPVMATIELSLTSKWLSKTENGWDLCKHKNTRDLYRSICELNGDYHCARSGFDQTDAEMRKEGHKTLCSYALEPNNFLVYYIENAPNNTYIVGHKIKL